MGGLPTRQAANGEAHERRARRSGEHFRKAIALDRSLPSHGSGSRTPASCRLIYSGRPWSPRSRRPTRCSKATGAGAEPRRGWASAGGIALSREQFANAEQTVSPGDRAQPELRARASMVELALIELGKAVTRKTADAQRASQLDPLVVDRQIQSRRLDGILAVATMRRSIALSKGDRDRSDDSRLRDIGMAERVCIGTVFGRGAASGAGHRLRSGNHSIPQLSRSLASGHG